MAYMLPYLRPRFVAKNWGSRLKGLGVNDSNFPSRFINTRKFWVPTADGKLRRKPTPANSRRYRSLPVSPLPACNDPSILGGVHRGVIDFMQRGRAAELDHATFTNIATLANDSVARACYLGGNRTAFDQVPPPKRAGIFFGWASFLILLG